MSRLPMSRIYLSSFVEFPDPGTSDGIEFSRCQREFLDFPLWTRRGPFALRSLNCALYEQEPVRPRCPVVRTGNANLKWTRRKCTLCKMYYLWQIDLSCSLPESTLNDVTSTYWLYRTVLLITRLETHSHIYMHLVWKVHLSPRTPFLNRDVGHFSCFRASL